MAGSPRRSSAERSHGPGQQGDADRGRLRYDRRPPSRVGRPVRTGRCAGRVWRMRRQGMALVRHRPRLAQVPALRPVPRPSQASAATVSFRPAGTAAPQTAAPPAREQPDVVGGRVRGRSTGRLTPVVRDVRHAPARLAVDGVGGVAQQTALQARMPRLAAGPERGLGEAEEQRDADDHHGHRGQFAGGAADQGDVAEAGGGERRQSRARPRSPRSSRSSRAG